MLNLSIALEVLYSNISNPYLKIQVQIMLFAIIF